MDTNGRIDIWVSTSITRYACTHAVYPESAIRTIIPSPSYVTYPTLIALTALVRRLYAPYAYHARRRYELCALCCI